MKVQLTNDQLLSLMGVLENTIHKYKNAIEDDFADARTKTEYKRELAIFEELFYFFAKKGLMRQPKYKFNLTPIWAFTFHLEYSGLMSETDYVGNVIQTICNKIDKHYQSVF